MRRIVVCFALVLAVMMLPFGALAETVSGPSIAIADPVISMNGETMLDMTGLALNLFLGATQNVDTAVGQLNVLAGDAIALRAMGELVAGDVVFFVDGMTDKYMISTEDIARVMNIEDSSANVAGLAASAQKLANPELVDDLTQIITDFANDAVNRVEDGGYETISLISKEEEMRVSTLTLTAEELDALVSDIFARLDAAENIKSVLASLAQNAENNGLEGFSFLQAYQEAGVQQSVDAVIAIGEDTGDIYVEAEQSVNQEGAEQSETLSYRVMLENDPYRFYADVDVLQDGQPVRGLYVAGETAEDGFTAELGDGVYTDGEFAAVNTVSVMYEPGEVEGHNGGVLQIAYTGENTSFGIIGMGYFENTSFYGTLTVLLYPEDSDNEQDFTITLSGVEEDGLVTGDLGLSFAVPASETDYGFACKYSLVTLEAEAEDILFETDGAVDILTMDDDQSQAFMNEILSVAMSAMGALSENVPSLGYMLNALTGLGQ